MRFLLLLACCSTFFSANGQVTHRYTPGNGNAITLISKNDSISFLVERPDGSVTALPAGRPGIDSTLVGKRSFLVKSGGRLTYTDHVLVGDSLLLLCVPDWNDRFMVYAFRKTDLGYVPSAGSENNGLFDYTLLIRAPYVFVNLDHAYVADVICEGNEVFYGDASAYYCRIELAGLSPFSETNKNVIRMDKKKFRRLSALDEPTERSFLRFIRNTLKKSCVPW